MRNTEKILITAVLAVIYIFSSASTASALSVNAEYITIYPGDQGNVRITVNNNGNFDVEGISIALVLSNISPTGTVFSLPFSVIGSSEKTLDDLNQGNDDSATFTLKASTEITPGDYNIPYTVKYQESGTNITITQGGTFGLRVSAKTDLDFAVETSGTAIKGQKGQITLQIINKGLGEIKAISVQVSPNGFDLLSKDKIFIGTISADDSDTATYDVLYKSTSPIFSAQVSYKDFENQDQIEMVNIPVKVYTPEQAKSLGLVSKSNTFTYLLAVVIILIIWYFWRRIRKRRKQKKEETDRR
jgi:hypothetical protein